MDLWDTLLVLLAATVVTGVVLLVLLVGFSSAQSLTDPLFDYLHQRLWWRTERAAKFASATTGFLAVTQLWVVGALGVWAWRRFDRPTRDPAPATPGAEPAAEPHGQPDDASRRPPHAGLSIWGRRWRSSAVRGLTAVAVVATYLGYSWLGVFIGPRIPVHPDAPRAAWLTHRWVGEPVRDEAVDRLARRLRQARVTDVYVHVGPLDGDGAVPASRAPHAVDFAAALHRRVPSLRVQAWLGQVEAGGGGPLDLGRPEVRRRVVATARSFLDLGYDGVHYDIEPIWDGDEDFVDLLAATARVAHADGKVVSVAAEELPVFLGADRVIRAVIPRYHPWTIDYHRRVARHVDQVAVMTYDSAMPLGDLYRRFVARNTRELAEALPEGVQLLIGVPTYAEWNVGHWPAERPRNALHGLRHGLARVSEERRARVGWAVYAEWTTEPEEWNVLSAPGS